MCERYTILRHAGNWSGPEALTITLRWYGALCHSLYRDAERLATIPAILEEIDSLRRHAAERLELDVTAITPLASTALSPADAGATAEAFRLEITRYCHLAAFRWWGG